MEPLSTSASHINPEFDAWLARRIENYKAEASRTMGVPPDLVNVDIRDMLMHIDWRLLPYITFDTAKPRYVKMYIDAKLPVAKGILRIMGMAGVPTVIFISPMFRKQPQRLSKSAKVLRYRGFKSKRWRDPKEIHEDQIAFYMLRYA